MPSLAVFVSSHGFGHAARVCAVVDAVLRRRPRLDLHIVSAVPRWFFESSLQVEFSLEAVDVDPGLVQPSALAIDLAASAERLSRLVPFPAAWIDELASGLAARGCGAVIADIAPLGIAVGSHLGVPTVLLENFTWDWIYRRLEDPPRTILDVADGLEDVFARADLRLRAEPACGDEPGFPIPPVRRPRRISAAEVRDALGVDRSAPMVLLSMGGLGWRYQGLEDLGRHPRLVFVVPGTAQHAIRDGALLRLPNRLPFGHPDLVAAADVVVGKLGYSTLAEAIGGGTRVAYLPRPGFPESPVLEAYVRRSLPSVEVSRRAFDTGSWVDTVEALTAKPRGRPASTNGADVAADAVCELLAR